MSHKKGKDFIELNRIVSFGTYVYAITSALSWQAQIEIKTNGILMISEILRLHFVSWRIHLITTPILYDVPPIGLRVRFFVAVAPPMFHCLVDG